MTYMCGVSLVCALLKDINNERYYFSRRIRYSYISYLQFEEGIEETVKWYLNNQEWMDNITSGDYEKYYDGMYKNR